MNVRMPGAFNPIFVSPFKAGTSALLHRTPPRSRFAAVLIAAQTRADTVREQHCGRNRRWELSRLAHVPMFRGRRKSRCRIVAAADPRISGEEIRRRIKTDTPVSAMRIGCGAKDSWMNLAEVGEVEVVLEGGGDRRRRGGGRCRGRRPGRAGQDGVAEAGFGQQLQGGGVGGDAGQQRWRVSPTSPSCSPRRSPIPAHPGPARRWLTHDGIEVEEDVAGRGDRPPDASRRRDRRERPPAQRWLGEIGGLRALEKFELADFVDSVAGNGSPGQSLLQGPRLAGNLDRRFGEFVHRGVQRPIAEAGA